MPPTLQRSMPSPDLTLCALLMRHLLAIAAAVSFLYCTAGTRNVNLEARHSVIAILTLY